MLEIFLFYTGVKIYKGCQLIKWGVKYDQFTKILHVERVVILTKVQNE